MGGARRILLGGLIAALVGAGLLQAPAGGLAKGGEIESGHYVGTTSQGKAVKLIVTQASVSFFGFIWRAHCADGRTHTNAIYAAPPAVPISAAGGFTRTAMLNTGGHFHVDGRVSGGQVSGHLSRWGSSAFGTDCSARGLRWKAHHT